MHVIETTPHIPTPFTRHAIQLHALLLENQVWFCARDLGHLMGVFLDERKTRKLDHDQRRTLVLHRHGLTQDALMISESGVYALLVYHHAPQNRELREWLTLQVVPALRDANHLGHPERPTIGLLDWAGVSLNLLHWQDEPWIRLRDMPNVLLHEVRTQRPWCKKATRFLSM
ncbi:BRO-N domain-containing protein [Pseudomonas sp. DSP3-2-2]|uniref:BRO-N domain-containing protein n=1 Tax=unclassified Pseudomonas TaxID=196821 RepID=UPI003CED0BC4